MVFADYDGDGREDIFTYSKGWAGIRVYRNVSVGHPVFQLVADPYLCSWQGGGEVNILSSEADYPAIIDVDGDGDLDLLTFGVMGTFIEKHRNLSMERYGCRDSLVFERTDSCWGFVAENEEDNLMYLDTCLFGYGLVVPCDDWRHRGATVTVNDLNGDGLLDLLLGDVDYPGLTLLINGGDETTAVMVSQTSLFPSQQPVHLFSMPAPFFTDIDNDGVDDLLVSPFDPDPMASEGLNSVWLYLNRGSGSLPDFQLVTRSFLQEQMIDVGTGAYPVIVDLDGDGLLDVVMGTIGNIDSTWYQYGSLEVRRQAHLTWMRNVGTADSPIFSMESFPHSMPELEGMLGLVPAFADLDGDGRLELLVGTASGRMLLFDDDGSLLDDDFLHYDRPWSAPFFYDVDGDAMVDLVVGNVTGRLTFYHGENGFVKVTDYWGEVDVRDYSTSYYGYSVPSLFRFGDTTFLSVGSESGRLFLFDEVSADGESAFNAVLGHWPMAEEDFPARFGRRSAASMADIDHDGHLEIIVGNFSGGLQLFNARIPVNNYGVADDEGVGLLVYPNPATSRLHLLIPTKDPQRVVIMDLMGRKLMERNEVSERMELDVEGLPSGVYLLLVLTERGGVSRIFLKR